MARQSLKACQAGIEKAKIALTGKGWTQEELAEKVETTRQPVANFFAGKGVDRRNFVKICEQLELDWQEIAGQAKSTNLISSSASVTTDINTLVHELREEIKPIIQERCGTIRVLDMAQPIGLGDIYTDVNILEKIIGRRGVEISELLQNLKTELDEFDRFGLGKITQKRISGIEAVNLHSKLMVLGKPGAGKTTFLKYLAIQCINNEFQENYIPIFITLKQFSETSNHLDLHDYIVQSWSNSRITKTQIIQLLKIGKFLILLDGLDEIKEEYSNQIVNQIKELLEQYPINKFIITCRVAAREYIFEKLTEVEVSDFDERQIKAFVNQWFQNKEPDAPERFIQQLELNAPIKELATNPLLLTLLCLEFEDSGDFPSDRTELYSRAIHTLLRKWDSKRGIIRNVRDEVYNKLSVGQKEDLLSEVAWNTFKNNDYFFKQRDIEEYIQNYICNLPQAKTDPNALRVDSEAVLKSIEGHHGLLVERAGGIYSFSHLTFHEYFTAREIVYNSNQDNALKILVNYINQNRWREVFLLTVGMLKSADNLLYLMKEKIDTLLTGDTQLQQIQTWINEKFCSVETHYKPAAVRAFYHELDYALLDIDRDISLVRSLDQDLDQDLKRSRTLDRSQPLFLDHDLSLDYYLYLSLARALDRTLDQDHERTRFVSRSLARTLDHDLSLELKEALQKLKDQLSCDESDKEAHTHWWQQNSQVWVEKLRTLMIQYRNIGHDWQLSKSQKKLLQQYYDANLLLVDCLKSSRYVNRELRQKIEDTLLLPILPEVEA
ncbi:NACHT domain-containing NTPase [Nostoc sp. CHAB 5844]|nr:NACHT domain-containing NTPase [Nostoc sp. CHAB 5844]